jgi:hypothetical protein
MKPYRNHDEALLLRAGAFALAELSPHLAALMALYQTRLARIAIGLIGWIGALAIIVCSLLAVTSQRIMVMVFVVWGILFVVSFLFKRWRFFSLSLPSSGDLLSAQIRRERGAQRQYLVDRVVALESASFAVPTSALALLVPLSLCVMVGWTLETVAELEPILPFALLVSAGFFAASVYFVLRLALDEREPVQGARRGCMASVMVGSFAALWAVGVFVADDVLRDGADVVVITAAAGLVAGSKFFITVALTHLPLIYHLVAKYQRRDRSLITQST